MTGNKNNNGILFEASNCSLIDCPEVPGNSSSSNKISILLWYLSTSSPDENIWYSKLKFISFSKSLQQLRI